MTSDSKVFRTPDYFNSINTDERKKLKWCRVSSPPPLDERDTRSSNYSILVEYPPRVAVGF